MCEGEKKGSNFCRQIRWKSSSWSNQMELGFSRHICPISFWLLMLKRKQVEKLSTNIKLNSVYPKQSRKVRYPGKLIKIILTFIESMLFWQPKHTKALR